MALDTLVDISRLQFAFTALVHFLFVPLTLGLSLLLVVMEALYVRTGRQIYKDMTKFWGKLFAINFAMGVVTGLTMEFQFGTNWAYYSHYVGDIFGVPLAIEGMMAFFLESTFIGLFFFGWDRLSRKKHLMVTVLVALGSNLSALWILIANGWMQHPVASYFNPETMRMELNGFWPLILNHVAQIKFLHTLSAGYLTGAVFVLGISSWYLLKGRDIEFARRSFVVAAACGTVVALGTVMLGDESGYYVAEHQPTKMAAIEAEWHTEQAPASFTVVGIIDDEQDKTDYAIKIPYALGLIATRSTTGVVPGIYNLVEENSRRIRDGLKAYALLPSMRNRTANEQQKKIFRDHVENLGYALLLKQYIDDPLKASDAMITRAAEHTVPQVAPLFWTFRIMVLIGFLLVLLLMYALISARRGSVWRKRWLLRCAVWAIPLPFIGVELGWFVAEYGRQPWSIYEVLPTGLAVSSLNVGDVQASLAAFVVMYSTLFAVELFLMFKYARLGPSALHTGRYHFEGGKV